MEKFDEKKSCVGCLALKSDLFSSYVCAFKFPIEIKKVEDYAEVEMLRPYPGEECPKTTNAGDFIEAQIILGAGND